MTKGIIGKLLQTLCLVNSVLEVDIFEFLQFEADMRRVLLD